jgi:hypothetical protein
MLERHNLLVRVALTSSWLLNVTVPGSAFNGFSEILYAGHVALSGVKHIVSPVYWVHTLTSLCLALICWSLYRTWFEQFLRYTSNIPYKPVSPQSGSISELLILFMLNPESRVITIYTTRFNILKLYILPTQCICVFHVVLTVNIGYFPKQH